MRTYIYPGNKEVKVRDQTVQLAPISFEMNGNYFEPESIDFFFRKVNEKQIDGIKHIVDIGAQVGLYSLYAQHCANTHFFSFEPNFETFYELQENCKLNNIKNISLFNKGVGENKGKLKLRVPFSPDEKGLCCFGANPLRFYTWKEVNVEVVTLDTEFYEKNIPVHFIKCDTEGWEPFILKGGKKTLEKWGPDLFIEVCETNLKQCGSTKEELFQILESYGYKHKEIHNGENYYFVKENN